MTVTRLTPPGATRSWGRDSPNVLSRRIPRAHAITVPDAGHMVNLEADDTVYTILRDAIAFAG